MEEDQHRRFVHRLQSIGKVSAETLGGLYMEVRAGSRGVVGGGGCRG